MSQHYFSPKLAVVEMPRKGGHGVLARVAIEAGEVLTVWGGSIVSEPDFAASSEQARKYMIQVEHDLFMTAADPPEPGEFFNHSCSPNAGIAGQIVLIAMRPIEAGEEVSFDYAMSDDHPLLAFDCACGSPRCRGRVTGQDWRMPSVQHRYAGYFSAYLTRCIARLGSEDSGTDEGRPLAAVSRN